MRFLQQSLATSFVFVVLLVLHLPYIDLPYFWDEAGYYIPAAWDIYKAWEFVPTSTLPNGHTPLVMTCLALAWHVFGYTPMVTRLAMILIASATVATTYALARRFVDREPAAWCAALLALSPLFFAQSTLAFLDLPAALFTGLAVLALLHARWWRFSLMASLAVLTKETAVVLLPVAWVWVWRFDSATPAANRTREAGAELPHSKPSPIRWMALFLPLIPLLSWTFYYHDKTGFWTGNAEYLEYNLRSTIDPVRVCWSLLRRLYEMSIAGFNALIVLGAAAGFWWGKRKSHGGAEAQRPAARFYWLAGGLIGIYVMMHSVVGGAILPRYLLPAFPAFLVAWVVLIWRLPRAVARAVCGTAAACFVAAWFINPPYPFAYENNLAYADFIRLHQDAARHLASRPPDIRILTAWPATDEISRPFLGYVDQPLRVVPVEGFTEGDFDKVEPGSFDVLFLYSRKWEPSNNWLTRFPDFLSAQKRYFGYSPQVADDVLIRRYGLTLERQFERRDQWVRIYSKEKPAGRSPASQRGTADGEW